MVRGVFGNFSFVTLSVFVFEKALDLRSGEIFSVDPQIKVSSMSHDYDDVNQASLFFSLHHGGVCLLCLLTARSMGRSKLHITQGPRSQLAVHCSC